MQRSLSFLKQLFLICIFFNFKLNLELLTNSEKISLFLEEQIHYNYCIMLQILMQKALKKPATAYYTENPASHLFTLATRIYFSVFPPNSHGNNF